jgi:hypothetical protein
VAQLVARYVRDVEVASSSLATPTLPATLAHPDPDSYRDYREVEQRQSFFILPATLAQLVEQRIRNARVVGSSPMSGSTS